MQVYPTEDIRSSSFICNPLPPLHLSTFNTDELKQDKGQPIQQQHQVLLFLWRLPVPTAKVALTPLRLCYDSKGISMLLPLRAELQEVLHLLLLLPRPCRNVCIICCFWVDLNKAIRPEPCPPPPPQPPPPPFLGTLTVALSVRSTYQHYNLLSHRAKP